MGKYGNFSFYNKHLQYLILPIDQRCLRAWREYHSRNTGKKQTPMETCPTSKTRWLGSRLSTARCRGMRDHQEVLSPKTAARQSGGEERVNQGGQQRARRRRGARAVRAALALLLRAAVPRDFRALRDAGRPRTHALSLAARGAQGAPGAVLRHG